MDKDKEDFFKEVPNQADLFPEEVKEEKNREIESVLDSFWADVPLKDVEEYYKAGKLANSHAPGIRMGREFMNGFIASYIDVAKKILRDENRSVTPQQKSLFKLLKEMNDLLLEELFENISEKDVTKEQLVAFFIGNLVASYNKIKEDYE